MGDLPTIIMLGIAIQYTVAIVLLGLMAAYMQWADEMHRPLLETLFHTNSSQECQIGPFGPFSIDELMNCAIQLVAWLPKWVHNQIVSIQLEKTSQRHGNINDFLRFIPGPYQKKLSILNSFMRVRTRTLQSDILRVFDAVMLTGLFHYSIILSLILLFLNSVRNQNNRIALRLLALGANRRQRDRMVQNLRADRVNLPKKFLGFLFIPVVVALTYRVVAGTRILTFSGASDEAVLASAYSYGFTAAVIIFISLVISEMKDYEDGRMITLFVPIVTCMVTIFVLQSPALLRDHNNIPAQLKSRTCNKAGESCKTTWTYHNLATFADQHLEELESILRGELQSCKTIHEMVRTQSDFTPSTCESFHFSFEEIWFENRVLLSEEWTLFTPFVLLWVVAQSCALPLLVCAWSVFVMYLYVSVFYSVDTSD